MEFTVSIITEGTAGLYLRHPVCRLAFSLAPARQYFQRSFSKSHCPELEQLLSWINKVCAVTLQLKVLHIHGIYINKNLTRVEKQPSNMKCSDKTKKNPQMQTERLNWPLLSSEPEMTSSKWNYNVLLPFCLRMSCIRDHWCQLTFWGAK